MRRAECNEQAQANATSARSPCNRYNVCFHRARLRRTALRSLRALRTHASCTARIAPHPPSSWPPPPLHPSWPPPLQPSSWPPPLQPSSWLPPSLLSSWSPPSPISVSVNRKSPPPSKQRLGGSRRIERRTRSTHTGYSECCVRRGWPPCAHAHAIAWLGSFTAHSCVNERLFLMMNT